MNRRAFLVGAAAAGGALALAGRRLLRSGNESAPVPVGPARYSSTSQLLEVSLEAAQAWVPFAGRSAYLYSFNGRVPGPILELHPGDTLRLTFKNSLPDPSNLHYHGMHVSPSGNSDNVFLSIPSGETQKYEVAIPRDHRPGFYWYHPHRHGLVADQISRGLAAPIIVRGDVDEIPEIAAAAEHILVLQDFDIDRSGHVREPSMMQRMMMGREGPLVTVNAELNPTIGIEQNGLVRLRLLNASVARFYLLSIEGHTMHLIGTDAGPLPQPRAVDQLLLTPGERVDLLVQGERSEGSYGLVNSPYARGSMGMMGGMRGGMMRGMGRMMGGMGGMMGEGGSSEPMTLATLTYAGRTSRKMGIPSRLSDIAPLGSPQRFRQFDIGMGMMMGMNFMLNGKQFDPERIDTPVKIGTVEQWEYVNDTPMDHPMHLHVNSFQAIGPDGDTEQAWRDVINVKANSTARFRVAFRDFAGKTVQHCHILDHEDRGLMATVLMEQ